MTTAVPPRPPLREAGLVTRTERARVAVPPGRFWTWFVQTPLEDVLPGGGGLPTVTGTEAVGGPAWGETGAHQRVFLSDGTSVHEAILNADPPSFLRYQVWGFEGAGGRLLHHAQGRFAFAPDEGGTQVAWTYAFAPRRAWQRPVVWAFVRLRFAAFMRAGLAVMARNAEAAHSGAEPAS